MADNGDVMFIVESYADYGKLSGQDLEQLQAGARVDVVDAKRNPARLRAVEDVQARRADLGQPLGALAVLAGTSSAPP